MIDSSDWLSPVLGVRAPMDQLDTDVVAELRFVPDIKAVIFDVYGTLVISGSGDVGSADKSDKRDQMSEALEAAAFAQTHASELTTSMLHEEIEAMNRSRRSDACPKPEVDIVEAWSRVLARGGIERSSQSIEQVVRLAGEYEARANPTWPMPDSDRLLKKLRSVELALGIVSNAQVFTPPLVADLTKSKNIEDAGFDLEFCYFSNRYRQSKPGPRLFDALRQSLRRRGILPYEAIYVGNDMLNDVWAASQAGLRTAWFAGDARSVRARQDDPRCRSLRPDIVLTDLMQLLECLKIK